MFINVIAIVIALFYTIPIGIIFEIGYYIYLTLVRYALPFVGHLIRTYDFYVYRRWMI